MQTHFDIPFIDNYLLVQKFIFRKASPEWKIGSHYHNLFELLYCWDGHVKEGINNEFLDFKTGDWLLIKSGTRHETINESGKPFTFLSFLFDIDDPELRKFLKSSNINTLISRTTAEKSMLTVYVQEIINLILSNHEIELQSDIFYEEPISIQLSFIQKLAFQSYVMLLVMEFIKAGSKDSNIVSDDKDITSNELDVANSIASILDDNIYTTVQINEISNKIGLSRSQCTKIFTKVYGIPPRRYFSNLKLKKSKELLIQTDLPIERIAENLGFSSLSQFSRQFKRWTGKSPKHFRPMHSKLNK